MKRARDSDIATGISQASVWVVIRTKDRPVFVMRAIGSVLAQTHPDWQIMRVNDGGDVADLKGALAADSQVPLPADRLTLLDLDPGQGRSAAFNRGVEALQTDFVTCLDDDDTGHPDFMAALLAFFAQTSAQVPDLGGVGAKVTALKEGITGPATSPQMHVIGEDSLPQAFHRGEFFLNPLAYACHRQDIYPVQWML